MVEINLVENISSIDIQIHFIFEDTNLHSMDANIFNECEKQFITALKIASKYLDDPLDIQVFAREEGGLKENLKIIITNPLSVAIIASVITAYCTSFFTSKFQQKLPIELETKYRLENVLTIKEAISSGKLSKEEFTYIASNDNELLKLKSNFFKTAKKEETLSQIELETDTIIDGHFVFDKISVPYSSFDDFILLNEEDVEATETNEEKVRIYIIAPILFKGKWVNWKGYYNGEPINFTISDNEFLEQVYSQEHKFQNGTFIYCNLRTTVNKNSNKPMHEVVFVENIGDDDKFTKPIKHKPKKPYDYGQDLFASIEDNVGVIDN